MLYLCIIIWLFFIKACGFEILVSQAKSTVTDTPVDLTYDKRWHHYKSSLADKGYFKVIINFNLLDFLIYTRNLSIFMFLIINYLVVPYYKIICSLILRYFLISYMYKTFTIILS